MGLAALPWGAFIHAHALGPFLIIGLLEAPSWLATAAAFFCRSGGRVFLLALFVLGVALQWYMFGIAKDLVSWLFFGGVACAIAMLFSPSANQWYRAELDALRAV